MMNVLAAMYPFGRISSVAPPATNEPTIAQDFPSTERPMSSNKNYPEKPKPDRPGKFQDLEGFLERKILNYEDYGTAQAKQPSPGHIIHITEEEDAGHPYGVRLHQRVMLVVRRASNCAVTCIPLCRHPPCPPDLEFQNVHWHVVQDDAAPEPIVRPSTQATSQGDRPALITRGQTQLLSSDSEDEILFIKLEGRQQLKEGITINVAELWHVEYDHLSMNIIGHVAEQSWERVLEKIAMLFATSLLPHASFNISAPWKPAETTVVLLPEHPPEVPDHERDPRVKRKSSDRGKRHSNGTRGYDIRDHNGHRERRWP